MSKVDWSRAPRDAEFFSSGHFRKRVTGIENPQKWILTGWADGAWSLKECVDSIDYDLRPIISATLAEWPSEQRIEQIGQNGATGEHYDAVESTQSHDSKKPASAADFLSEGLKILSERGNQYGSNQRECSFPQAADAFNAITGHSLKGSDICLILALVKQVRQYAQPRFHEDSAVDAVNYLALQAELLKKERQ